MNNKDIFKEDWLSDKEKKEKLIPILDMAIERINQKQHYNELLDWL
jgi:hypothetical protein